MKILQGRNIRQSFKKTKLNQNGEFLEILLIFKIEAYPIKIKLIPTRMMENLYK